MRERIAGVIGPTMRIGLQDAQLFDGPGAERIEEWITWISGAVSDEIIAVQIASIKWADRARIAEATNERFRAVVADVQRCQEDADPSERMKCAMCCSDHFADLAAALDDAS
jgi:hypothetical protein